ncbi:uncharacterized protein LOC143151660 [Ptiloglossa arizonensis]|uniref:uncharacterized protein LOC143151660 n=1 Tax=Ptiloglossa arizonensis TaxID=3350558 RepID=UPI003FA16DAD
METDTFHSLFYLRILKNDSQFQDMIMNYETAISLFIAFYSISNFGCCYSYVYDRSQIMTYTEPFVSSSQLPIAVKTPQALVIEETVPLSLNSEIVPDTYVQSRLIENPLTVEVSDLLPQPSQRMIVVNEPVQTTSYALNTYALPVDYAAQTPTSYTMAVEVPVAKQVDISPKPKDGFYQRLKGLTTHVDRVLVPACNDPVSHQC